MGENSKIEWTDHTFNPWIGCTKVSDGCKHCYAEALMDKRYGRVKWGPQGTRQRTSADNWRKPLQWNKQAVKEDKHYRVFCSSLADVFEDNPQLTEWRADLFNLIAETPNLDWLLLTKRPENINRMVAGYAAGVAARFSGAGQPYEGLARFSPARRLPQWSGEVRLVQEHLADPLRWRRPRMVFVNSMSDLFHEALTNEQIAAVFGVMAAAPRHTFQVLTKRAKRMREWFAWVAAEAQGALRAIRFEAQGHFSRNDYELHLDREVVERRIALGSAWPLPNVWLGVSAEDQRTADERVPELLATPAAVRWISVEPQIGPVSLRAFLGCPRCHDTGSESVPGGGKPCGVCFDVSQGSPRGFGPARGGKAGPFLDWVVQGGESGPRARPFNVAWADSLREESAAAGVAYFLKQLGSRPVGLGHSRSARGLKALGPAPRHPKGGDPENWPERMRVRQWPKERRGS
jgi:protein gp37